MAASFAIPSRSISTRPLLLFLEEILLLRKAAHTVKAFWEMLNLLAALEKGGTPGWISFCRFCCGHGTM